MAMSELAHCSIFLKSGDSFRDSVSMLIRMSGRCGIPIVFRDSMILRLSDSESILRLEVQSLVRGEAFAKPNSFRNQVCLWPPHRTHRPVFGSGPDKVRSLWRRIRNGVAIRQDGHSPIASTTASDSVGLVILPTKGTVDSQRRHRPSSRSK